jgi:hypothetical protein
MDKLALIIGNKPRKELTPTQLLGGRAGIRTQSNIIF